MKKILFFSAIFGLFMIGVANAAQPVVTDSGFSFPSDSPSPAYPEFVSGKPTNATQKSVKDDVVKVATTKYVDKNVTDAAASVNTLQRQASEQSAVISANGTAVTELGNRLAKPTGTGNTCPQTCGPNGNAKCKCGYISANGPNGTRKWIVIQ